MRYLLLLLLLSVYADNLHAQDTLYKMDGSRTVVNILEIKQTVVNYKTYSSPDGPVFVLNKSYISKIVRQNGETISFPGMIATEDTIRNNYSNNPITKFYGRHFFSLNTGDLLSLMVTLNYEYTFKSGKFSLKFPLSTGLYSFSSSPEYYYNERYVPSKTIIGSGIDLYYYPFGQKPVAYFLGPSFEFRIFRNDTYVYDPITYVSVLHKDIGTRYRIFFQNGVLFKVGIHFNLSLNLGLGYSQPDQPNDSRSNIRLRGGLNIGYKF
jgi:hypothetical protein